MLLIAFVYCIILVSVCCGKEWAWVNNNATNKWVRPDRMVQNVRCLVTNRPPLQWHWGYVNPLAQGDSNIDIVIDNPITLSSLPPKETWPIIAQISGTNQYPSVNINTKGIDDMFITIELTYR